MKYGISLLCLLFSLHLSAQYPAQGLEVYYSFDNCTAIDTGTLILPTMGNINATSNQGLKCEPTGCSIAGGGSLYFNGVDDKLIFITGFQNIFSSLDFSLSFYIKPENAPGISNIFHKREDCSDVQAFAIDYIFASNTIDVTLSEGPGLNGNVRAKLDFDRCWQHIVLTRQGTKTSLYVNGTLRDEAIAASVINITNASGLTVSSQICEDAYKGGFDELFIYRRALNANEVKDLFYNPDQILNRDTTVFLGESVDISLTNTCATSFLWTPDDGVSDPNVATPTITPDQTTTYSVEMGDTDCQSVDSITITILDPDVLDCSVVYFPKAFTPNDDNLNDVFGISNPNAVDDLISFEIFDRWGSRVFFTDNPFVGWNGDFLGEPVNPGVMLYRVKHICQGEEKVAVGSLSIIR